MIFWGRGTVDASEPGPVSHPLPDQKNEPARLDPTARATPTSCITLRFDFCFHRRFVLTRGTSEMRLRNVC
jgi:hypothetical protein